MVCGLPIPFTQTAPFDHNNLSLPKIVHGKNLSYSRRPSQKKKTFKGTLVREILFQGKGRSSLQARIL
jgi:hypothetical protein